VDKGEEQDGVSKEASVWHERRLLVPAVASIDDQYPTAKQKKKQMPPQRKGEISTTIKRIIDHATRTHELDM
jgi:hypothetical protein